MGGSSVRFRLQLDVSDAVLAHDFVPQVFDSGSNFLLTVRAAHVGSENFDRGIIGEGMLAMFALHPQAFVFAVDPQFLEAAGTADVVTTGGG